MAAATIMAYSLALLVAVATPGPAMFAVITTGVARGLRPALAAGAGVVAADLLLVTVALVGLAALMATFGWLFTIVKYAGAAYLIWIGIRMWRARPADAETSVPARSGALCRAMLVGLTVGLSNPKAILFHASLMPLILDLRTLTAGDALVVLALVAAINGLTMGVYGALASGAARWFRAPARLRLMNRVAGGAMIGTGVAVAAR